MSQSRLDMLTRINRATAGQDKLQVVRSAAAPSTRPYAGTVLQFAEYAAEYRAEVQSVSAQGLPALLARPPGREAGYRSGGSAL